MEIDFTQPITEPETEPTLANPHPNHIPTEEEKIAEAALEG